MENTELMNMCMVLDGQNNRMLMQNRNKGTWRGWVFPGGHIEPGEPVVDSTVREVFEETGLRISDLQLVGVKNWYKAENNTRAIVFLFVARSFAGELIEHGEEGDVAWFPLGALPEGMADGFEETIRVFLDASVNEQFIENTHGCERKSLLK